MDNEIVINDNEFLRQFEYKTTDGIAKIEYSLQERKIFLTKLIVPESLDNDDFKDAFIRIVLDSIQERNLRVVPTSPKIASFLRKHKEYKDLLPVGVRI
ncbi:N-acetyltransferase [Kordia sp. YSTF-M3]|uniref:N-acetyltransferase n=1 Tax=Kordia aestuariivivens TaxID=2759037 RepID=A0ABR7Q7F5_9FLAO|nr:N-acetyltransferase [Kordia aestuariivivens]MBC8754495.1 N-acetyltransferase [Kordia aestuariivivens]